MNDAILSPIIDKSNLISFPVAIEKVAAGRRITKKEWNNENIYGVVKDGTLMLHKDDGKFYKWIITDGDLLGNDWYVLPEVN